MFFLVMPEEVKVDTEVVGIYRDPDYPIKRMQWERANISPLVLERGALTAEELDPVWDGYSVRKVEEFKRGDLLLYPSMRGWVALRVK